MLFWPKETVPKLRASDWSTMFCALCCCAAELHIKHGRLPTVASPDSITVEPNTFTQHIRSRQYQFEFTLHYHSSAKAMSEQ